jgi:hypothetical protein
LSEASLRSNEDVENRYSEQMILFYSEHCNHCKMLLDTIKRHDGMSLMKLVSIEGVRAAGRAIPPRIQAVPAIAFDNNNVIFGKQVFDYLLLPGRGLLLTQAPKSTNTDATPGSTPQADGPSAFTLGAQHSDAFSMIEGDEALTDKNYVWASVFDSSPTISGTQEIAYQEDTRSKKELPDINTIREQRQLDLQQQQENHINIAALTPPTSTRL